MRYIRPRDPSPTILGVPGVATSAGTLFGGSAAADEVGPGERGLGVDLPRFSLVASVAIVTANISVAYNILPF